MDDYMAELRRKSREEIAARRRALAESKKTGKVCAKCGEDLGDHAAYRAREYGDQPFAMMCRDCAPEWLVSGRGKPMRIIPAVDVYAWDCVGCGRRVIFGLSGGQYRKRVYCSDECRKAYARQRKSKGGEAWEKTCEVCDSEFVAKRSDARTCSPACRQKLYRKRLQVSTGTDDGAVNVTDKENDALKELHAVNAEYVTHFLASQRRTQESNGIYYKLKSLKGQRSRAVTAQRAKLKERLADILSHHENAEAALERAAPVFDALSPEEQEQARAQNLAVVGHLEDQRARQVSGRF